MQRTIRMREAVEAEATRPADMLIVDGLDHWKDKEVGKRKLQRLEQWIGG